MGAPTDKFLDFCGTRLDEAMAERGSGRGQSVEARRYLTADDLKKYIADEHYPMKSETVAKK